jgi:tetratricopeptide (TPR) repeat protein
VSDRLRACGAGLPSSLSCLVWACLLTLLFLSTLNAQGPSDNDLIVKSLDEYRTGNCKEAKPLFEKILLDQPKNTAVRKLLGRCLMRDNRVEEARHQFQLVLDDSPQDMEAYEGLRGATKELQKRWALRESRAIESREETSEQLRASHELRQAELLIKARRLSEAEGLLQDIVRRHPESLQAQRRLAEIYTRTHRFAQAAEIYRRLAAMPKASSVYLLRLAQNLEWGGKVQAAIIYYRRYLSRNPRDQAAQLALANLLLWNGHYSEAADVYRQYLHKNPQNHVARLNLVHALMWSKRYREAVPELRRLQAEMPWDVAVPLALGQCYEQLGEMEPALQAYDQALKLDPANPVALEARASIGHSLQELPRRKAFEALERNDLKAAAQYFGEYLKNHPGSAETLLEIARVNSWAKDYRNAETYYKEYLKRVPQDYDVLRELANLTLWTQDYSSAREYFTRLVASPSASTEDFESLIHAFEWSGDLAGAQPFAKQLIAREPNNLVALQALRDYNEQQRLLARTQADDLAAAGKYAEATRAYKGYMEAYGKDRQIELTLARLYSSARQYDSAINAYEELLREYPQDLQARLELADVMRWAGKYGAAEGEYQGILQEHPRNVQALVGLARVQDERGDDPFKLHRSFQNVLSVDATNPIAEKRLEQIHPQVSPALGLSENDFWDSDGLFRSVNSAEVTFPLPRRVKLTPFYTFGYFHQLRLIRGGEPGVNLLDQKIGQANGTVLGNGGGARLEAYHSVWSLLGELSGFNFDSGRSSLNARAVVTYRPGEKDTLGLTYVHRDAIYDVNTVASLMAGIMGDTFLLSYERALTEHVRLWTAGGVTHYSAGVFSGIIADTQPRLSVRLDYQPRPWITLGYSGRGTGFTSQSPLYFSPPLYQTHGLAYRLNYRISGKIRLTGEGELDYGRISFRPETSSTGITTTSNGGGTNTFEMSIVPNLAWQLRRDIILQLGYRFSRGQASAFGSPVYRTQGAEIVLSKIF